ncbi:MAG TPA: TRAP transporter large permease subunit, partial [Gammaproteobacteria bacterium]|nr:TRAP transporter large permease subunit [Gammaproteobacteria bacterium]
VIPRLRSAGCGWRAHWSPPSRQPRSAEQVASVARGGYILKDCAGAPDVIIISATCFAYVYRSLGGDDIVEHLILSAGLTSWQLLILLMGITFMLGFFLDWIEITLIVLPVFAPLIVGLDFGEHIASKDVVFWFLVLMAINLQTSFLTPPFGFALFYLKGIAPKEVKIQEIYKGIIPFVLLQLCGLILVMWKPNVALWLMKLAYDY